MKRQEIVQACNGIDKKLSNKKLKNKKQKPKKGILGVPISKSDRILFLINVSKNFEYVVIN